MTAEQQETARNLLKRARVSESTIKSCENSRELWVALLVTGDFVNDRAPDKGWFKDFYLLTGDHMQLTDEGWVPAHMNTKEYTGYEPAEVLDEVNAPVKQ